MKKYTLTEYEKTGKMLYIEDKFYMELEEYLEQTPFTAEGFKLPTIYGTEQELIGLDTEELITILEERDEAYDGYEVDDAAKRFINTFVEGFNKNYADHSYIASEEIIIEPTAAELEEVIDTIKRRIQRRLEK